MCNPEAHYYNDADLSYVKETHRGGRRQIFPKCLLHKDHVSSDQQQTRHCNLLTFKALSILLYASYFESFNSI